MIAVSVGEDKRINSADLLRPQEWRNHVVSDVEAFFAEVFAQTQAQQTSPIDNQV